MDKIEEVVEEFIEKWRHESNIGVTLKELIEKHGKLKTVGELFDAEMRADLQEIVDEAKGSENDRIANKILNQPWVNAISIHNAIIRDEWDI